MSTKLVKYWVKEHHLKPENELSQDEYDDSDWLKIYKAEEVERAVKSLRTGMEDGEQQTQQFREYLSSNESELSYLEWQVQRLLAQLGRKP